MCACNQLSYNINAMVQKACIILFKQLVRNVLYPNTLKTAEWRKLAKGAS